MNFMIVYTLATRFVGNFRERIIKSNILVSNKPFQLLWDIKAALEDKQNTKEVQESLKMTRSTNKLELLGNQATAAEHVTRFARLLSRIDRSEKAVSSSLNQGRFKALLAGDVTFLFQNCATQNIHSSLFSPK